MIDTRVWRGLEYWAGAAEPGLTIDSLIERCDVVTVGIHAAGIDALSGMAVLGRDKADGALLAVMLVRAHNAMRATKDERAALNSLRDAGHLPVDAGAMDDIGVFMRLARRLNGYGLLPQRAGIGVNADIPDIDVSWQDSRQAVTADDRALFAQATWLTERLLCTRGLRHCGSPVMDWMVNRGVRGEPYDGWFVRRPTQFDGPWSVPGPFAALITAVGLMQRVPPQERVLPEMGEG